MTRQKPIDAKAMSLRTAVAVGEIRLSKSGRAALRRRATDKGDPRAAAELAGLLAMKRTPELIPHCHPVPLTGSEVTVEPSRTGARVTARAEAIYRTGVEMEALVGASVALLTVWDMVKELEKDGEGQYPNTRLGPVRVVSKRKRPVPA